MRNFLRAAAVAVVVALSAIGGSTAVATSENSDSVVVCKYVSIPGVDERLQTGQNPIVVSSNSLTGDGFDGTFPFTFSDAQGQSIAIRYATSAQDGDISECPGYVAPSEEPTPSTEPTESPTPSVLPTPTPTPSNSPVPSETNSPLPSLTPTLVPTQTMPPTDTASSASSRTGKTNWLLVMAFTLGTGLLFSRALRGRVPASRRVGNRRDW